MTDAEYAAERTKLRDHFATVALRSILAIPNINYRDPIMVSKAAYDLADEMLCQRVLGGKA